MSQVFSYSLTIIIKKEIFNENAKSKEKIELQFQEITKYK